LRNIQYLNGLIESGYFDSADEENDALLGIKKQMKALKRTFASYPNHFARLFPNISLPTKTINITDISHRGRYPETGKLKGNLYIFKQRNGTYSEYLIKRFDKGGVHIIRNDIRGQTKGIKGEYIGKLTGNRSAKGTVTWMWKKWTNGTWEASWQEGKSTVLSSPIELNVITIL